MELTCFPTFCTAPTRRHPWQPSASLNINGPPNQTQPKPPGNYGPKPSNNNTRNPVFQRCSSPLSDHGSRKLTTSEPGSTRFAPTQMKLCLSTPIKFPKFTVPSEPCETTRITWNTTQHPVQNKQTPQLPVIHNVRVFASPFPYFRYQTLWQ